MVAIISVFVILLSIVIFCLETLPEFKHYKVRTRMSNDGGAGFKPLANSLPLPCRCSIPRQTAQKLRRMRYLISQIHSFS